MELRSLFEADDAVSSVLGVVLMVAVTIVLAAVVGTFVLGIGSDLTDGSPQASWDFSENVNDSDDATSNVVILHGGGEDIDRSAIEVTIGGEVAYPDGSRVDNFSVGGTNWSETISSGDRLQLTDDGNTMESGQMVRIVWQTEDSSNILAKERLG